MEDRKPKAGDIVIYTRSQDYAYTKGSRGVIIAIRERDEGKPMSEYQVFWTKILDNDGNPLPGQFWTTPDDCRLEDPDGWMPIDDDTPWQTVIEVTNSSMEEPVAATRGFETGHGVCPDFSMFTSRAEPNERPYRSLPPGSAVSATKWRHFPEKET